MTISTNTTFLPRPPQTPINLQREWDDLAFVSVELSSAKIRYVLRSVLNELIQQRVYADQLRLSLDDALRAVHQLIAQRPATGPIADRPAPSESTLYLSTDETPEVLYISNGDVWHGINTDS